MTKKMLLITVLALLLVPTLSAQQVNIKFGIFSPFQKSDLWDDNFENLSYAKSNFSDFSYSVEYQQQIHRHFSFYVEGSHYENDVYSEYRDYEYSDGSPIEQSISLSISAIETGIKFNLLPYRNRFSPYVGAGAGIYIWEYIQEGEFIDFNNMDIYDGMSDQSTISLGFHLKAGLSLRITRGLGFLLEGKASWAKGDLGRYFEGFEPLDVGGLSLLAGFQFYF